MKPEDQKPEAEGDSKYGNFEATKTLYLTWHSSEMRIPKKI